MKNVFRNSKSYFIFFCICTLSGKAQLIINIAPPSSEAFTQNEIWNVVINNVQPYKEIVYLEAELSYKTSGIILKGKSITFEVPPGITTINSNTLNNVIYDYPNPQNFNYGKSEIFPQGSYNLCISIIRSNDNLEIGKNCIQFNNSINSNSIENSNDGNQLNLHQEKHVKFYGKSELLGNYQTHKIENSNIPPNYIWWSINPSVSIFDLPLSVQTTASTYNSNSEPSLVTLSFNFDAIKYKSILKSKAIKKITEVEQNQKYNNSKTINLYNELSTIRKTLNNPSAISDLKRIDELKRIENQLTDSLKNKNIHKYDSLKNRLSQYNDVYQKKIGYERLQQKESQLENQVKRNYLVKYYRKYAKASDSLSQLKNIDISKVSNLAIDSLFNNQNIGLETAKSDLFQEVNQLNKYQYDYSKLDNPDVLKSKLYELGLFNRFDKLLFSVKNLSLGTSYPYYNDLTLNNVIINGINVEIQPGKLYLAFTKGSLQKPVFLINTPSTNSETELISGGFGYGYKNSSHIYFFLLDFRNNLNLSDTLNNKHIPESNQILSTDFKLDIFKNHLSLEGTVAGSQSARGFKDSSQEIIYIDSNKYKGFDDPNNWITNILTQQCSNLYASVDYAYKVRIVTSLFNNNTKFEIGVRRVGPNFFSLGLPYLQSNIISYEAKLIQNMFKKKLLISMNLIQNQDKINNYTLLKSFMTNFGFSISLNIPKKPYIRLNYNPIFLKNDSISYNLRLIALSAGHTYKIGNVSNNSNFSLVNQHSISDENSNTIESYMLGFNHTLNFKANNTLNLNLNYVNAKNQDTSNSMYNIGFSVNYILFKKVQNIAGINYLTNQTSRRFGYYYEIRYKLSKSLNFNIRAERNSIDNYIGTENGNSSYKDFVVKTSITMIW